MNLRDYKLSVTLWTPTDGKRLVSFNHYLKINYEDAFDVNFYYHDDLILQAIYYPPQYTHPSGDNFHFVMTIVPPLAPVYHVNIEIYDISPRTLALVFLDLIRDQLAQGDKYAHTITKMLKTLL